MGVRFSHPLLENRQKLWIYKVFGVFCLYKKITDSKSLGEAIRIRRKELKYTQANIAEFTGFSVSFISDLERGKATAEIGKAFDWGRTSEDYAKYRDIYPEEFYQYILKLGLCKNGQRVLDIGTGTGVLPRNMYKYGAEWTGIDISENQIEQARRMAAI